MRSSVAFTDCSAPTASLPKTRTCIRAEGSSWSAASTASVSSESSFWAGGTASAPLLLRPLVTFGEPAPPLGRFVFEPGSAFASGAGACEVVVVAVVVVALLDPPESPPLPPSFPLPPLSLPPSVVDPESLPEELPSPLPPPSRLSPPVPSSPPPSFPFEPESPPLPWSPLQLEEHPAGDAERTRADADVLAAAITSATTSTPSTNRKPPNHIPTHRAWAPPVRDSPFGGYCPWYTPSP